MPGPDPNKNNNNNDDNNNNKKLFVSWYEVTASWDLRVYKVGWVKTCGESQVIAFRSRALDLTTSSTWVLSKISCWIGEYFPRHIKVTEKLTLWLFNSSPWYRWPIEMNGLPINSMVIFHGYVSHNQRVSFWAKISSAFTIFILISSVNQCQTTSNRTCEKSHHRAAT